MSLEFDPTQLGILIRLVESKKLSRTVAKKIFEVHLFTGQSIEAIIKAGNYGSMQSEDSLTPIVAAVLEDNPKAVADILAGKEQVYGFLIGQVMRRVNGQADPQTVRKVLDMLLKKATPTDLP